MTAMLTDNGRSRHDFWKVALLAGAAALAKKEQSAGHLEQVCVGQFAHLLCDAIGTISACGRRKRLCWPPGSKNSLTRAAAFLL